MFVYIKYITTVFFISSLLAIISSCHRQKQGRISTPSQKIVYYKQRVWKLPSVESLPASMTTTYAPNGIMGGIQNRRSAKRQSNYPIYAKVEKQTLPVSLSTATPLPAYSSRRTVVEGQRVQKPKPKVAKVIVRGSPVPLMIKAIPPRPRVVMSFSLPTYGLTLVEGYLVAREWTNCLKLTDFSTEGNTQVQLLSQGHYQLLAAFLQPGLQIVRAEADTHAEAVSDCSSRLPIAPANLPRAFQKSVELPKQDSLAKGNVAGVPMITPPSKPIPTQQVKKTLSHQPLKLPIACTDLLQRFNQVNGVCNTFTLTVNEQNVLIGEGCHPGMTFMLMGNKKSRIIRQKNKLYLVNADMKQNAGLSPMGYQNKGDSLLICREITLGKTTHKLLTIYRRLPQEVPPRKLKRWYLFWKR